MRKVMGIAGLIVFTLVWSLWVFGQSKSITPDLTSKDQWVLVGGKWQVAAGEIRQTQATGKSFAYVKEPAFTDFDITLEFFIEDQDTGVRAPGIAFRATTSDTCYYWHLDQKNQAAIFVRSDDTNPWIEPVQRFKADIPLGEWVSARVVGKGGQFTLYLNGDKIGTGTDATYSKGLVGLRAGQGLIRFRNIKITGQPAQLEGPFTVVKEKTQVIASQHEGGNYCAFPDVCRLDNGDLMCVFYAGYGHVSLPNENLPKGGFIAAIWSSDNGKSWTDPVKLIDTPYDDRDPSVAQLPGGRVIVNWFSYWPKGPRPDDAGDHPCAVYTAISNDGGKTFGKPRRVITDSDLAFACSAPVRVLSDGSLIMGLYHEAGGKAFGATIKSYDNGDTWKDLALIGRDSGKYLDAETDVCKLGDGRLMAALRTSTSGQSMCYAISEDMGRTWSKVREYGFPGHCPCLIRTKAGVLVLAHRVPATSLHYSLDGGKTWSKNVSIDPSHGGAYPSMVELPDGTIYCVYYEEGTGSNIRGCRFRITKKNGFEWVPVQ